MKAKIGYFWPDGYSMRFEVKVNSSLQARHIAEAVLEQVREVIATKFNADLGNIPSIARVEVEH